MKLSECKDNVKIKNVSGGRIGLGKLALAHNESKIINPVYYSNSTIESLELFLARKKIEVEFLGDLKENVVVSHSTTKKETLKNEHGDKNEHVVFDPETSKKNKLINVEEITGNDKPITVNNISRDEAVEFLEQHWKKVEKEVESILDINKLEFILSVAVEIGMEGNKKYELVEERIEALK